MSMLSEKLNCFRAVATTGGFSLILSRYFRPTISTGTMLRNHNETLVEDAE